jgi:hypothetical protein
MEILEAEAFRTKLIEVRGFEDRISVGGDVAIALIIGDDE